MVPHIANILWEPYLEISIKDQLDVKIIKTRLKEEFSEGDFMKRIQTSYSLLKNGPCVTSCSW